jgi:quinol-cytochrome oxidoreductase complex cytochrome b subunit
MRRRFVYSLTRTFWHIWLCITAVAIGYWGLSAILRPGEEWVYRVATIVWLAAIPIGLIRGQRRGQVRMNRRRP